MEDNSKIVEIISNALKCSYNTTLLYNTLDELTELGVKLKYRTTKVDYIITKVEDVKDVLGLDIYRMGNTYLQNAKYVSVQVYYADGYAVDNVQIRELTPSIVGKVLHGIKLAYM